MEIGTIKRQGCVINVIFDGRCYFFHNAYYGLIAYAKRNERRDEYFTIYTGNHHCLGGSFTNRVCSIIAKRFITQSENKYIPKEITFYDAEMDLADKSIQINLH